MATSTRKLRDKSEKVYKYDATYDDDIEGTRTFDVQEKLISDVYDADFVLELTGPELTVAHMQRSGNKYPIIIHDKAGLGMRVPSDNFRVSDVKRCVGSRRVLDVMDVKTQKGLEMTLKEWEAYYENPVRDRLLNVISLEFSHTRLDQYIDAPAMVRQVDFINSVWPPHLTEIQTESTNILEKMMYPKVQKYCLMSVGNCYTDFHVDFGGTSVWYHILRGCKIFWLIEPTDENLELYMDWVLSGKQGDVFFGDKVSRCQRITLKKGDTFIIPSGWIHGVYTSEDSLVFGGNFLHSFNLVQQLKIVNVEDRTRVPAKFRFPFFAEMMWYVLAQYVRCFTGHNHFITPSTDDEDLVKKEVKKYVHMTPYELEGLEEVILWIQNLPPNRKNIPKDLTDIETMIDRVKDLLREHAEDDPELAVTGKSCIYWPDSSKKAKKQRASYGSGGKVKDKVINANRRRRTRCKKCEACLRDDCEECTFCQDMRKFGGPGRMKQSCKSRQCMAPMLPASAFCLICGNNTSVGDIDDTYEHLLMECGICWDITHPACLRDKHTELTGNGSLNDALPNSWQCPKCCDTGKMIKPRVVKGVKMSTMRSDSHMDTGVEDEDGYTIMGEEEEVDEESSEMAKIVKCLKTMKKEELPLDSTNLDHTYSDRSPERNRSLVKMEMLAKSAADDEVADEDIDSEEETDTLVKTEIDQLHKMLKTNRVEKKVLPSPPTKSAPSATISVLPGDKNIPGSPENKMKSLLKEVAATDRRKLERKPALSIKKPIADLRETTSGKTDAVVTKGKRVTMHGRRAELTSDELTTCRKAGVVLERLADVTPILEKFGEAHKSAGRGQAPALKKSPAAKISATKLPSATDKRVQIKTSSSESDGDVTSKRPRREVVMPKRYLE